MLLFLLKLLLFSEAVSIRRKLISVGLIASCIVLKPDLFSLREVLFMLS